MEISKIIKQFIKSSNAFDVDSVLNLFAENAIIDDVSVGDKFENKRGVRNYLETYFVEYETVTKLESIEVLDQFNAEAKVDFTGNFGHETGGLNFKLNSDGLIVEINAYLD